MKGLPGLVTPIDTRKELAQLEANIVRDGCRDPLVVWGEILIDGHNRFSICTRLEIKFKTMPMEFENRSEAKEWIIRNQFGRRNLSAYERGKLALALESEIAARAKGRQEKTKPQAIKLRVRYLRGCPIFLDK